MATNPYPGINAHLNSLLQTPGKAGQPALWRAFHNQHIAHIADFLNAQLPAPYFALNDQSLQTRSVDEDFTIEIVEPIPDVSVFQRGKSAGVMQPEATIAPTWEAAIEEIFVAVRQPRAVVIRELLPQSTVGQVVARIELLSPSNKASGSNFYAYSAKRIETLEGGTPLIEIDYLHESPSLVPKQPRYPLSDEAFPYTILVSDPRPDWHEGKVRAYSFHVGERVKTFRLPLHHQDEVLFDLNTVYQHTFETGPWSKFIDYSHLPDRFETYSQSDQASILAVMAQVRL